MLQPLIIISLTNHVHLSHDRRSAVLGGERVHSVVLLAFGQLVELLTLSIRCIDARLAALVMNAQIATRKGCAGKPYCGTGPWSRLLDDSPPDPGRSILKGSYR